MAGWSRAAQWMSCGPAARAWSASTSATRLRAGSSALADVELVERTQGRAVFKLDPAADPQRILDAARAAGSVTHFAELQPTLAELFREVVSP